MQWFGPKMDNPAYQGDPEKGTELDVVHKKKDHKIGNASNNEPSTSCRPDVCRAAKNKYSPPELSTSPWHRKKTVFLIGTIVLLIVWIIVYATLSKLKLL